MNQFSIFQRPVLPVLATALLVATGAAQAADWSWQASSGLLPREQPGGMASFLQTSSPGGYTIQTHPDLLRISSTALVDRVAFAVRGSDLLLPAQADVRFTARDAGGNTVAPLIRTHTMVSVGFGQQQGLILGLGGGEVFLVKGDDSGRLASAAVDTTVFHDYRIMTSGTQWGDAVSVYVDGALRLQSTVQQGPLHWTSDPRLWFGDGTQYASGSSEWTQFSHNLAAVPEPGSMALLLAGLALVGGVARRRGGASQ